MGELAMMPTFDVESGHLPVGRYSCSPEDARAALVEDPRFQTSQTRADIWSNFERYLSLFFALEEKYADVLPMPLIDRIWLGGSFVSAKLDPRNVDATLHINRAAKEALKGKPGVGVFARSRGSVLEEFKVSRLFLDYEPVVHVFRLDQLEESQRSYLAGRGAWDDWWQRRRGDGEREAPTLETCPPRRGYLEVVFE
ncbi:hypothetical protein J2T11_003201 [Paenarthrobacter nicotinovorans]|nr:hypothetical protein [Paenarthrobacter nicotinovorans]